MRRWGRFAAVVSPAVVIILLLAAPPAALGHPEPLRGHGRGTVADSPAQPPPASQTTQFDSTAASAQPATNPASTLHDSPDSSDRVPSNHAVPHRRAPDRHRREAAQAGDVSAGVASRNPSVRPRRDPAPVDLGGPVEPEPPRPARTPQPAATRVWPLRPGAFDFTQAFGCVSQLGDYYGVVAGCPPEMPAVHTGIDLAAPQGSRIYAAAAGWVVQAGLDRPTGLANTRIVIQHDGPNAGFATEYLHWTTTYVRPGQYVRAGQPIAEVGSVGYSTGPHLHFSVVEFESGDWIDPIQWLPQDRPAGAYLGIAPGSVTVTFDDVSVALPDYADPSPPPAPRRESVPDHPPDAETPALVAARQSDDRAPATDTQAASPEQSADTDDGQTDRRAGDRGDPARTDGDDRGRDAAGNRRGRLDRDDARDGGRREDDGRSGDEPVDGSGSQSTGTAGPGPVIAVPPPVPAVPAVPLRTPPAPNDAGDVDQTSGDAKRAKNGKKSR